MTPDENKKSLIVLMIILLVMAAISLIGVIFFRVQPEILQGQIETTRITISGKLPGRIESFYVTEGELVSRGDTLVHINSPEVVAELAAATAMESAAKFQNIKVDSGTRPEIIKSLEQALNAAEANYRLAGSTQKRMEKLYLDSIITSQKMDEVNTLYKNAESAMNAARAQYEMALAGAQVEDKMSAKAMVDAAAGNVMAIESLLYDTHLTAPESGEIGAIYPSRGELVMPGTPIMDIIVTDSCYAVLNIKEDLMPHFQMGSKFKGSIPALGNKEIWFKIFYISPLGSFANWHSSRESGSYNIVTFQIKARPVIHKHKSDKKENKEISGLRPGMSILVEMEK